MDALAFCIVACLVIAGIALFVKIFNKGKSLHPAQAKEYEDHMRNLLSHPAYDDIPGNIIMMILKIFSAVLICNISS